MNNIANFAHEPRNISPPNITAFIQRNMNYMAMNFEISLHQRGTKLLYTEKYLPRVCCCPISVHRQWVNERLGEVCLLIILQQ